MKALLLIIVLASGALAQRHRPVINAETDEGKLLQQIGQATDDAAKIKLMEQFAQQYPQSSSLAWVYDLMQPAYIKASQFDQAISTGEKLLLADGDDVEAALQNLKAAEGKKDPALVKTWSERTSQLAKKAMAEAKPNNADAEDEWKKRLDYATQVNTYTEYSLYAQAAQATDPKTKLQFVEALRQRNPQSQYLPQIAGQEFLAYRQLGDNAKAIDVAEKVLATDQSNEDMLLVVADSYLRNKQHPEKVIAYSAKMVEVMGAKPKPEGVSDADWNARKTLVMGLGHYMSGKMYMNDNKYAQADKELREALPLIGNNKDLKAETTFLLGLANYRMKKIPDAIKYNQMCAEISGPYQAQAQKNIVAMRAGK